MGYKDVSKTLNILSTSRLGLRFALPQHLVYAFDIAPAKRENGACPT
jgi:hypothetical protein